MTISRRRIVVAAAIAVLVAALPAVEAAGRRTASGSGTSRGSVASRPASGPQGVARGRATYGHAHRHPAVPYGGWYHRTRGWGWGEWWAAPYWGPWGWPWGFAPWVAPDDPPDLPGTVETAVQPKNATLRVDGEDLGRAKDFNGTWDSLRLPPGFHVLEFSREGYRTFRAVVDIRPGRTYRVERILQRGEGLDPASDPLPAPEESRPALAPGFLDFRIRPADAAVYLDGEFLAQGAELERIHGAIPVAPGTHRIEVVRPGHVSRTLLVEVEGGGGPTPVEIALDPNP